MGEYYSLYLYSISISLWQCYWYQSTAPDLPTSRRLPEQLQLPHSQLPIFSCLVDRIVLAEDQYA